MRHLAEEIQASRDLLPLIPRDELTSYLILDKHPLYQYRNERGEIHILCLGSGAFGKRMILSLISCGQIVDTKLHVHVVSMDDPEEIRAELLRLAPMLEQYSDLVRPQDDSYVAFHITHVEDILNPETCRRILKQHGDARYLLVSLGSGEANARAAALYAHALAAALPEGGCKTILNYYCPEAPAASLTEPLPQWLEVDAFGDNLDSYVPVLLDLAIRTIRLAHMYNKLSDPRISLQASARGLSQDAYSQRSSCAAALHLKYKLAGVGIDPAGPEQEIPAAYQEALESGSYEKLLENEHRRWLLFMAADRYTLPTEEELKRYGFAVNGKTFNGRWRYTDGKLHPCMVPSSRGITLDAKDWEIYKTREAIEGSDFDALDKMSLTLHRLAGEKCREILSRGQLTKALQNIAQKLNNKIRQMETRSGGRETPLLIRLRGLHQQLEETEGIILGNARTLHYSGNDTLLEDLEMEFAALGLDIGEDVLTLRNLLCVFAEYAACKDYKKPEGTLVLHLPWILYADQKTTLIKLPGRTVADNITSTLVLDPEMVVFFEHEEQDQWDDFLRSHGCRGKVSFVSWGQTAEQTLRREVTRREGRIVIDVTGAEETAVLAAYRLCLEDSRVALIRSKADGTIENLHNYPFASIYTLDTCLTAEDVYALHGAEPVSQETQYMEALGPLVPTLWDLYQQEQTRWHMITTFFATPKVVPCELYYGELDLKTDLYWTRKDYTVDREKWKLTQLEAVLQKLEKEDIIRGLRVFPYASTVNVMFDYPKLKTGDYLLGKLNWLFGTAVPNGTAPYRCDVQQWDTRCYTITISSGCMVGYSYKPADLFWDKNAGRNSFSYQDMNPVLRKMEQMGLISGLSISPNKLGSTQVAFTYPTPAVWDCLKKAGNILELYIWNEARRVRFFDDVRANFSFQWKEGVRNELDVILTKGLSSWIISAKTGWIKKEYLYEIKYLTDRFSLNSTPVIVFARDQAQGEESLDAIRNRAEAMGIHMVCLADLETSLGEALADIAGKAPDQPEQEEED